MSSESDQGSMSGRRQLTDRRVRHDPAYDATERRRSRGRRSHEASPRTENLLEAPDPDSYLNVSVVLSRVGQEFDYVETDEASGQRHVEQMIEAVLDRIDTTEYDDPRARARHLAAVKAEAIHVRCGDNPTSEAEYLSMVIVPGEPIRFVYESLAHEIAARPLLQRLARALGYKIVQWEVTSRLVH